jgi:hypothetical protein
MNQFSTNIPAPAGGDSIVHTARDGTVKLDVFFKEEDEEEDEIAIVT